MVRGLYLIEILHQTTTPFFVHCFLCRCILSKFYIKPQLIILSCIFSLVVSYRNSTSNHNKHSSRRRLSTVVSYRNSTSNHNFASSENSLVVLYLIEILHQTTTNFSPLSKSDELYLIEILHQTTTCSPVVDGPLRLYLIEILHQTTTLRVLLQHLRCCILSKFYIKPQHSNSAIQTHGVVSYRNSTSNHNSSSIRARVPTLYLIEILHQTTTTPKNLRWLGRLYLIEILHQTTTYSQNNN